MDDRQLIGYCALHCETDRALFVGKHVNRMIELAGFPESFVREVPENEWFQVKEPMEELCKLARERIKGGVVA